MFRELIVRDFSDIDPAGNSNEGFFDWVDHIESAIPPRFIQQALKENGVRSLNGRKMSAAAFVWLIVALCLYRRKSVSDVMRHFELRDAPTDADVCSRRKKLGSAPIRRLFELTAGAWNDELEETFAGLRVRAIDGTCFRLADTADIEEHFGRPQGDPRKAPGAWPMARAVTVMGLRSRLVRAAAFGPWPCTELELFEEVLRQDLEPSLFVMDRGFGNWVNVVRLRERGHHALIRMKSNYGAKARVVEVNGPGDEWIEPAVSSGTRKTHPWMPKRVRVRRVHWREDGHRDKVIITTLGPDVISTEQVIAAYRQRWEIELSYNELKTHMLEETPHLRSRTADRVDQELWGTLIAYNIVRVAMARAAATVGLPPCRLRYKMSLLLVRDFLQCACVSLPGAVPRHYKLLLADLASDPLPKRRSRSVPRKAKKKPSRYPLKKAVSHLQPPGT